MTGTTPRTGDRHDRTKVGRLIRGNPEMWQALDRRAEQAGLTSTEAARQAITDWCQDHAETAAEERNRR